MNTLKKLITGANGFVGSALCAELRHRGTPVVASVRRKEFDAQYEIGDITANTNWKSALEGCDTVFHLAARVHLMNDTSNDPLASFRATNVDATLNLAQQAAEANIKRFVFASSVKVNGEETFNKPFLASDDPHPVDPYGQSKLEAEIALKELSLSSGMEVVIIRPPLVYGPGVRANFLRLMQLVQWNVPLPLGAIHNARSMVSLDNLVDFLVICGQHPNAAGEIFMVSDDNDVSISQLLRLIASAMGKKIFLPPIPSKLIEVCAGISGKTAIANRLLGSLQVDIEHTKLTLNWQPVESLQQAIAKTVAHFQRQH
ncbi:SDR family oxidoreductase [Collimonas sp.]|uniref:UDP-glucose 4-epimerase family protein n=1 Tax=Collimonas sp. TaxID=1963772 RepID=UPI002C1CA1E1|nr:SDR family oxidoreductase [Collimonas sp.]HWX00133.1 SDR family oxidoreductase [Collimonas sp.]